MALELVRAEAETIGAQPKGLQQAAVDAKWLSGGVRSSANFYPTTHQGWVALGSTVLFGGVRAQGTRDRQTAPPRAIPRDS
jgi:hypothetical protein